MGDNVAVFDVGKTNVKLIVFDRDGKVVAERSQLNAPLPPYPRWPYLRLDAERACRLPHRLAARTSTERRG